MPDRDHMWIVGAWRILLAWLAATATTYVLAAVAHTQTVLAGLSALDVPITWSTRMTTTAGDLIGLWRYGVVIGIALAIALIVMRMLSARILPDSPRVRAVLAGVLAMAVMLGSMRFAFAFTPVASARFPVGFILQCVAGAAGGGVHAWLGSRRNARQRERPATP